RDCEFLAGDCFVAALLAMTTCLSLRVAHRGSAAPLDNPQERRLPAGMPARCRRSDPCMFLGRRREAPRQSRSDGAPAIVSSPAIFHYTEPAWPFSARSPRW